MEYLLTLNWAYISVAAAVLIVIYSLFQAIKYYVLKRQAEAEVRRIDAEIVKAENELKKAKISIKKDLKNLFQ